MKIFQSDYFDYPASCRDKNIKMNRFSKQFIISYELKLSTYNYNTI